MNMHVGPIKPTIIEGLRQWRFLLEENEWGIAYDLDWRDTKRQVFHGSHLPAGSGYPTGRKEDVTVGFEGFGTLEGWVEFDGKRIAVSRDSFHGTREFREGIIDYVFKSGEKKQGQFKLLGNQTAFMKCGMYGGTPERNIYHGQDMGELVEGDRYDVANPDVRKALSGLNEHHCVITCDGETTTGIIQPVEPDAYDACAKGIRGWAFLD